MTEAPLIETVNAILASLDQDDPLLLQSAHLRVGVLLDNISPVDQAKLDHLYAGFRRDMAKLAPRLAKESKAPTEKGPHIAAMLAYRYARDMLIAELCTELARAILSDGEPTIAEAVATAHHILSPILERSRAAQLRPPRPPARSGLLVPRDLHRKGR